MKNSWWFSFVRVKLVHPMRRLMARIRATCLYQINKFFSVRHVNLGGGPDFIGFRWSNLEAVVSDVNPHSYSFSHDCIFPFPDGAVDTVYNSHNLEHLEQLTVDRVLAEACRILKPGGYLVLKIPNFDHVLKSWREGDCEIFDKFSFTPENKTWVNRGVPDSLDTRATCLFCGFWNDEYGDHFSQKILNNPLAYHGPPVVSAEILSRLKLNDSPHFISERLRAYVVENEPSYHFNHQNAWSMDELKELVTYHQFEVVADEAENIIRECGFIPTIRYWKDVSMYLLARKRLS
jgi:SAM-dependent methyltransferase